jgi:hypothetical protein
VNAGFGVGPLGIMAKYLSDFDQPISALFS